MLRQVHPEHIEVEIYRADELALALDINNLQPMCSDENTGKGNWDSTDWR